MTKRYRVESYDAHDIPDVFWRRRGEFDTADEALKCAQSIVRGSLEGLYSANPKLDAQGLKLLYSSQGQKPSIFGEPRVDFHAPQYGVVAGACFVMFRTSPERPDCGSAPPTRAMPAAPALAGSARRWRGAG
jgi:hypothetical protein